MITAAHSASLAWHTMDELIGAVRTFYRTKAAAMRPQRCRAHQAPCTDEAAADDSSSSSCSSVSSSVVVVLGDAAPPSSVRTSSGGGARTSATGGGDSAVAAGVCTGARTKGACAQELCCLVSNSVQDVSG